MNFSNSLFPERPVKLSIACGCCGGCCCWALVAILYTFLALRIAFPGGSQPVGDALRRELKNDINAAIANGNWDSISAKFLTKHAALVIGTHGGKDAGIKFTKENGWMSLDSDYAVASQTKFITALTIYRLMLKSYGKLSPETRVAEYIDNWPQNTSSAGGQVTLAHLLAFTTGFDSAAAGKVWCARAPAGSDATWASCVDQIAHIPIEHLPGTSFLYGPWHMVVAAAVAHRALGRPLTTEAWEQSVKEEIFDTAGIEGPVSYDGVLSDFPSWYPILGSWYTGDPGTEFPDFSAGLRMTGMQWAKVLHTFTTSWEDKYPQTIQDEMSDIQTLQVNQVFDLAAGSYGYAQGCWRTCDAATEEQEETGRVLTFREQRELCGNSPVPRVVQSVGAWGFYAWADLTSNHYGVFVFSYAVGIVNLFWIGLALSTPLSIMACCCCMSYCETRRFNARRRLISRGMQVPPTPEVAQRPSQPAPQPVPPAPPPQPPADAEDDAL